MDMAVMAEDQELASDQDAENRDVLSQARKLLAEGQVEKCLDMVRHYWLENPDDAEAVSFMSEVMKDRGRSELSKRLAKLSEHLPLPIESPLRESTAHNPAVDLHKPDDATLVSGKQLFEAGYSLIEARQHELAAMLLNRASKLVPGEPTVNYELGFALMSMRRFEQAIPYLEEALDKDVDFDTLLNLLVCYTLTRQVDKADETLQKIGTLNLDPEQKQEFLHRQMVVKRLASKSSKSILNARDWLYILYGSVLLKISKRQDGQKEDAASIGHTLAILKGVMQGLCVDQPEVIEFYGPQSRPLAQAMAEFLEISMSAYQGPGQKNPALLTMTWASDIIGPHKSFVAKQKDRHLFSYGLSWDEPLPVVPDIVGCLCFDDPMPWRIYGSASPAEHGHGLDEPRKTMDAGSASLAPTQAPLLPGLAAAGEHRYAIEVEKAYKNILANARDLESDPRTIKHVQEALDYYESKRPYLIIGNSRALSTRSEYTAEILD